MFEEIEGEKDGEPVKMHDLGSRYRLGKPSVCLFNLPGLFSYV